MKNEFELAKQKLAQQDPEQALTVLHRWVQGGDRKWVNRLEKLRGQAPSSKQQLTLELNKFVKEFDSSPPELKEFLTFYHAALEAMEEEKWEIAAVRLTSALEYHRPSFSARRKMLETKLATCTNASQLEQLVADANHYFLERKWEKSIASFQEARKFLYSGCPWSPKDFSWAIQLCQQGEVFWKAFETGKSAEQAQNWDKAEEAYTQALAQYKPDFQIEREELNQAIARCQRNRKGSFFPSSVGVSLSTVRKILLPVLALGMVSVLAYAIFFHTPDPSFPTSMAEAESLAESKEDVAPLGEEEFNDGENLTFSAEEGNELLLDAQADMSPAATEFPVASAPLLATIDPEEEPIGAILPARSGRPEVDLGLSGVMRAGETLTFSIRDFDPALTYELNLGNGQERAVGQRFRYAYGEAGQYNVSITASHPESGRSILQQQLLIETAVALTVPTPVDSSPVESAEEVVESKPSVAEEAAPPVVKSAPVKAAAPVAPLTMAEVMPSFPGGEQSMYAFLQKRLKYPPLALDREVSGTVYLRFVVETDGRISGLRVLKGIQYGCDEEALRIAREMPKWLPGKMGDQAVPVLYTLPIRFTLP